MIGRGRSKLLGFRGMREVIEVHFIVRRYDLIEVVNILIEKFLGVWSIWKLKSIYNEFDIIIVWI